MLPATERRALPRRDTTKLPPAGVAPGAPIQSVFIRVHPWLKTKTPPPVWQWGSTNLVNESEPDRRAAQPQRV